RVRVSASNRFGQEWGTLTGSDGSYVLYPTRDFYTVSGEAADFVTATITNVQVTQGLTTTLNIALPVMHYMYFPLIPHKFE
ncbi:MAG: carboxypeptidase regulatory-like domain-containing protein, partial [Anaerolineales bacterium]|nr:carboxypeptidase regulatory-like domain-containing protein [Anaerolineales bacterium]